MTIINIDHTEMLILRNRAKTTLPVHFLGIFVKPRSIYYYAPPLG